MTITRLGIPGDSGGTVVGGLYSIILMLFTIDCSITHCHVYYYEVYIILLGTVNGNIAIVLGG